MKPGNVFLSTENLVAQVADFGLAKAIVFQEGREHMTVENVSGHPDSSPRSLSLNRLGSESDVYAYGVTLIAIMTGGERRMQILWKRAPEVGECWGKRYRGPDDGVCGTRKSKRWRSGYQLGVLCTARVPVDRPGIDEVLHSSQSTWRTL